MRRQLLEILKSSDWPGALKALRRASSRRVIAPLFSALCSADPQVKWRAVEAMGVLVSDMASADMESAREVLRRLMWSLNEESGSMGWGAPEAMGEIMAGHEQLAREFAPILLSYIREGGNDIEHPLLRQGVFWGLVRLAESNPSILQPLSAEKSLVAHLNSGDPMIRGLAARALGSLGSQKIRPKLEALLGDMTELTVYEDGQARTRQVGRMAEEALLKIKGGSP